MEISQLNEKYQGKEFIFDAKKITVNHIDFVNGRSVIVTDKRSIPVPFLNLEQFIKNNFKPILNKFQSNFKPNFKPKFMDNFNNQNQGTSLEIRKPNTPQMQQNVKSFLFDDADKMNYLKDVLFESIEKVRNDASYIPQANQISQQIRTLTDMAKTEIIMRKM
jgi:hypothetical protein